MFYRVFQKGQKDTSYILGSIHLADNRVYKLDPLIIDKLKRCDQFLFELDINSDQVKKQIAKEVFTAPTVNLKELLSDQEFEKINELYKQASGIDLNQMPAVPPFMISAILLKSMLNEERPVVLDEYLGMLAKVFGKKVNGLETPEEQMRFLKQYSKEELLQLVKNYGPIKDTLEILVDTYAKGDFQKIEALTNCKSLGEIMPGMEERNEVMVKRSLDYLKSGSAFITVGVGHLFGNRNVLELLRKQGYTVESVQVKNNYSGKYRIEWPNYGISIDFPGLPDIEFEKEEDGTELITLSFDDDSTTHTYSVITEKILPANSDTVQRLEMCTKMINEFKVELKVKELFREKVKTESIIGWSTAFEYKDVLAYIYFLYHDSGYVMLQDVSNDDSRILYGTEFVNSFRFIEPTCKTPEECNSRGVSKFRSGFLESSLSDIYASIKLDSNYYFGYNSLAAIYFEKGNYPKSKDAALKAISIDPSNYKAHYNLGHSYWATGEFQNAFSEFEIAVKLRSPFGDGYYYMGSCKKSMKDYTAALELLNKAIALSSDNYLYYEERAEVYKSLGKKKEAGDDLKKARALDK